MDRSCNTWTSLLWIVAMLACSTPNGPVPSTSSYEVRLTDIGGNFISDANVWLLDAEGDILDRKTIGSVPVHFDLERGLPHRILSYKPGYRADEVAVVSRRDSLLTRVLPSINNSFILRMSSQWSNGSPANISGVKAFVFIGSVAVDTLQTQHGGTMLYVPSVADEMRLRITAADCDTIELDIDTLSEPPASAVLTQLGEPIVSYQLTVRSAYADRLTGLAGVNVLHPHSGVTATTDASGMVQFSILDSNPRSITIQSDHHEPLTVTLPQASGNHTVYLDPMMASMVPLFEVNVEDVWHFTGRNLSTSMGLTTTIISTFEWRLTTKQPGDNGSTLMTFISSGSGTRSHP